MGLKVLNKYIIDDNRIPKGFYEKYAKTEINNLKSSKHILIEGYDISLYDFICNCLSGYYKGADNRKVLYLGKLSKKLSNHIVNKLNDGLKDLHLYNLVIDSDRVFHVIKRHGDTLNENNRGQVPISYKDFENIPYIVSNFDDIKKMANTNNESFYYFVKYENDGTYNLYCLVSDKRHNLSLATLYINRQNKKILPQS